MALSALRALLDAHGYHGAEAMRLLGAPDPALTPEEQRTLWSGRARRLSGLGGAHEANEATARLAILLRLFLLQEAVEARLAGARLGSASLALLREHAFVRSRRDGDGRNVLTPALQISLHGPHRVVSDCDPRPGSRGRSDLVFGPTHATMALAQLTPRRPVRRALDLGCGAGLLALRLATHAEEVVATDVLARAVELTALNAALDGCAHLVAKVSDRFEALRGRRFDLVTANLPFVISPERRFVYRDAGGASFLASVLEAVPRHLAPRGWALLLAQWPLRAGDDPATALAALGSRRGACDTLVLVGERESAERYAARWSAGPAPRDRVERDRRYEAWTRHYRGAGIVEVATGLFVLRPAARVRPALRVVSCPSLGELDGEGVRSLFLGSTSRRDRP